MSWLRAHAAFGQIAAGAATNPQGDKSGSAADQMGAVAGALGGAKLDEKLAAWFDSFWAEQAKTRDLKDQARLFILFTADGQYRIYLLSKARDQTKADVSAVKRMYDVFLQKTSASLVAQFHADPDKGLATWPDVLRDWYRLLVDPRLRPFRQQVESRLLEAYMERAAAELRRQMAGVPQSKLNAHVDDVRHIVRDYSQKFLLIAVGALDAWDVPLIPPDRWPAILSTGSELSGFLSGAVLLPFAVTGAAAPVALVVAAGVLLVGEKAGTLYTLWSDLKDKEQQYRQDVASRSLKEALRTGYEQLSHFIENQQDLLAPIFTVGAIKAGLDFESEAQEPIRTYVWQQLFKDFPQDPTQARQGIAQALETAFKSRLAGP